MMSTLIMPMLGKHVVIERINEYAPEEPSLAFYVGKCIKISDVRLSNGDEKVEVTLLDYSVPVANEIVFEIVNTDWYYWGFTVSEEPVQ